MLEGPLRHAVRSSVAALVLLVAPGNALALPGAKDAWIEVRTPHFLLVSDAAEPVATQIGLRLERLRHVLSLLPGELDLDPHRPTYIYVFKDWASSRPYFPQEVEGGRVGGAFIGLRTANYVLINASPDLDAHSLIYHEYLHAVMHQNFPNLPLWLQEGMAEFYSTFWADDEQAEIGGVIDEYVQVLLADGLMDLPRFFAVTADSPEYRDIRSKQRFHAQAWALVHYLMMARADHRLQLWAYMKRQQSEALNDPLSMGLLPFSVEELDRQLSGYVESLQLPRSRLRSAHWPAEIPVQVTPMERAQTLFRLGDLLAHRGRAERARARKHFQHALRLQPDHAPSHAGLGLVALDEDPVRATARFETALKLDPENGYYAYLLARSLLRQALGPRLGVPLVAPPTEPRVARAGELLEDSVRFSPDFAEAWISLGYTYVLSRRGHQRGIEVLESARRMVPGRMDAAYYLLVLYLRQGRREDAEHLARGPLALAADAEWAARARAALAAFGDPGER